MNKERFNQLLDELDSTSLETLKTKNAKYAPADDALHNFHYGAQLDNSTTAQTIWHYMKKHMVALLDKIERDDWEDIDDTKEKIQDIINYLRFIWCAANENNEALKPKVEYAHDDRHGCHNCRYLDLTTKWDDTTGRCLDGECATCKGNFVIGTDEYNEAPFNWRPIEE